MLKSLTFLLEDMKTIKKQAENKRKDFQGKFEKLSKSLQYMIILDNIPLNKFLEFTKDKKKFNGKIT